MKIGLEEIKLRQKISKLWDELDALNGLLIVTRDCMEEKKEDEEECYMDLGLDVIKCMCVLVDSLRRQAEDIAMMTAEMNFGSNPPCMTHENLDLL